MKPKKRQKLCFNCEGEVDLDVIVCPFCAADLREEQKPSFSPPVHSVKQLHTEQSLYPPPYARSQEEAPPIEDEPAQQMALPIEEEAPDSKSSLLATVLVTFGVQLFLLSILMIFCSDQGVLILKWNAHSWIYCFVASLPMLYFGYRALNRL